MRTFTQYQEAVGDNPFILQKRIDNVLNFIRNDNRGNIKNEEALKILNFVENTLTGARDRFLR